MNSNNMLIGYEELSDQIPRDRPIPIRKFHQGLDNLRIKIQIYSLLTKSNKTLQKVMLQPIYDTLWLESQEYMETILSTQQYIIEDILWAYNKPSITKGELICLLTDILRDRSLQDYYDFTNPYTNAKAISHMDIEDDFDENFAACIYQITDDIYKLFTEIYYSHTNKKNSINHPLTQAIRSTYTYEERNIPEVALQYILSYRHTTVHDPYYINTNNFYQLHTKSLRDEYWYHFAKQLGSLETDYVVYEHPYIFRNFTDVHFNPLPPKDKFGFLKLQKEHEEQIRREYPLKYKA